jgi:hypothetical protein
MFVVVATKNQEETTGPSTEPLEPGRESPSRDCVGDDLDVLITRAPPPAAAESAEASRCGAVGDDIPTPPPPPPPPLALGVRSPAATAASSTARAAASASSSSTWIPGRRGGGGGAAAAAAKTSRNGAGIPSLRRPPREPPDRRDRPDDRGVAVQVDPFESKGLKPGCHFKVQGLNPGACQAMGQLHLTCTAPPRRQHRSQSDRPCRRRRSIFPPPPPAAVASFRHPRLPPRRPRLLLGGDRNRH